jgi:hypothetical protein
MGVTVKKVVIPEGESLSGMIDLEGYTLASIKMSADWTAAGIGFVVGISREDATPYTLYSDAEEVIVDVAADRVVGIAEFAVAVSSMRFAQVRSGTAGVPVAQAAERVLYFILKG